MTGQRALPLAPPPPPGSDPGLNYGEVFTRPWVVEFILDLAGYTATTDLATKRLVDPACGDGAFLLPVAERVIRSCEAHGRPLADAEDAVRGFDLQLQHVITSQQKLVESFTQAGASVGDATRIAESWVGHCDFLVAPHDEESVDFVVGNPPYIRPEDVPEDRMAFYRQACPTMSGRADIYVGFFEVGLRLLSKRGVLGFICADRWMRNAYGRKLREFITRDFSVEVAIEMHDVDAFANKVAAYPAITILRRDVQAPPLVVTTTAEFDAHAAQQVSDWSTVHDEPGTAATLYADTQVARLDGWFENGSSWPTGSPERLSLLRELETRFLPLERDSTRVGIGVATGADSVYLTRDASAVEADRLIPLAMTRDTTSGVLVWGGTYLINPWAAPQQLVDLKKYPLLAAHFDENAQALKNRHVAGRRPGSWYRTIDPVHTALTGKRKLLLPDMKMFSHPVLDPGGHYPHHNLYYIVSDDWDLEVLGGLLMSRVAQFFVEAYAVRMRGGTLRFQAQYLRRIRLPEPKSLDDATRKGLQEAFQGRDVEAATTLALAAYQIDHLPD